MRLPLTGILQKAADKIQKTGLAKGGWAFDKQGKPIPYRDSKAYKFDLLGCVFRSAWEFSRTPRWSDAILTIAENRTIEPVILLIPMATCEWHIANWNDATERTAAEVIELLGRAKELAYNSPFEEL